MYHYTSPLSIPGCNQSPEYLNGHKSGKSLDWDKSSDVDHFIEKIHQKIYKIVVV